MQKVMCQMLSAEQLQEWESGRTARLNEYAKQRQCWRAMIRIFEQFEQVMSDFWLSFWEF